MAIHYEDFLFSFLKKKVFLLFVTIAFLMILSLYLLFARFIWFLFFREEILHTFSMNICNWFNLIFIYFWCVIFSFFFGSFVDWIDSNILGYFLSFPHERRTKVYLMQIANEWTTTSFKLTASSLLIHADHLKGAIFLSRMYNSASNMYQCIHRSRF